MTGNNPIGNGDSQTGALTLEDGRRFTGEMRFTRQGPGRLTVSIENAAEVGPVFGDQTIHGTAEEVFEAGQRWPQVMVDVETMGTTADAAVFEVGVVCFDLEKRTLGPELVLKVDLEDAVAQGQVIEAATLAWWMDRWQKELSEVPLLTGAGRLPLIQALWDLSRFWEDHAAPEAEMWARGNLEAKVLEKAMAGLMSVPWKYSKVWDQRSITAWEGVKPPKLVVHSALLDARAQVLDVFTAAMMRDTARDAAEMLYEARGRRLDFAAGWDAYRRELLETLGYPVPVWEEAPAQLREAWCAGVRKVFERPAAVKPAEPLLKPAAPYPHSAGEEVAR